VTGWRLSLALGLSQFIGWGVSYYLIGVMAPAIAADFGWSLTATYAGFSAALVVMGLISAPVGRVIDAQGGRRVMAAGSVLMAAGCAALALAPGPGLYALGWLVLGLAMRMSLYDAAFAALVQAGGGGARRAISHVTLLGGLASTAFWPLGHALQAAWGWRAAVLCYAALALFTLPLHLALPRGSGAAGQPAPPPAPARVPPGEAGRARWLVMVLFTLAAFLNAALSAHLLTLMAGLGIGAALAVTLSTLRGIAQSGARLLDILFGARLDPPGLALLATLIWLASMVAALVAPGVAPVWAGIAAGFGAAIGLLTIVRGALPLHLFGAAGYGATQGRLAAPGFLAQAAAPLVFAALLDGAGPRAALVLAVLVCAAMAGCALALRRWR